jgi:Uncharacterized conserved protein
MNVALTRTSRTLHAEKTMASGYWIMTFRSISDPVGVNKYVAAASPVIQAHGGRVLAVGLPAFAYESGMPEHAAIVEFASVAAADAAYRSPEYQAAVQYLRGAAERDVRIIEGTS